MPRWCANLVAVVALATAQAHVALAEAPASIGDVVSIRLNDGTSWTATLRNGGLTELARLPNLKGRASNVALAPDGRTVAYTRHNRRNHRSVEVVDLTTGHITGLSAIPTQTSYGPEWSGDGRVLAINVFDSKSWNIALVGPDNTGYRALDSSKAEGCMNPSWAPSGQWLCCTSRSVWRIAVDGTTRRVLNTAEKIPSAAVPMPGRCSISADEDTVVFEADLRDSRLPTDSGGGFLRTLYAVKASGDGVRRVGPDNFWASEPRFVDERRFLFLGFSLHENRSLLTKGAWPATNLYLANLDGGDAVLLRRGVRAFSVANRRRSPSNPALNPTGLRPAG